jgi:hypothetical protein
MAIKMGVLNKKLLWQYYSPIPNIILMYKLAWLQTNTGLATLILK